MEILAQKTGRDGYGNRLTISLIRIPAGEEHTPSPVTKPYDVFKVREMRNSSPCFYGRTYRDAAEARAHFERITLS